MYSFTPLQIQIMTEHVVSVFISESLTESQTDGDSESLFSTSTLMFWTLARQCSVELRERSGVTTIAKLGFASCDPFKSLTHVIDL